MNTVTNDAVREEVLEEMGIPKTFVHMEDTAEEVGGFDVSFGAEDDYLVNLNLVQKNSELVKLFANSFLTQAVVSFALREDNSEMSVDNAVITAMYGFKSFTFVTKTLPIVK